MERLKYLKGFPPEVWDTAGTGLQPVRSRRGFANCVLPHKGKEFFAFSKQDTTCPEYREVTELYQEVGCPRPQHPITKSQSFFHCSSSVSGLLTSDFLIRQSHPFINFYQ
jgi:hypothetical protein